jgi:anti-sigma B factor antagonist
VVEGESLRIDVRRAQDRVVLELHGELDLAAAPLLQDRIERESNATAAVVLDLDDLEFMDSAGLRVILAASERSTEHGRTLALTPGSTQVQRLLSITGLSGRLRTIASPDALLA